jgi:two-component system, response regulator RegA
MDSIAACKGRLLIVDDEENQCRALKHAFESRGYDVRCARLAAEALCVAEAWRPSYVVLDLRMPGPSGLTLISRLGAASPGVRVVVLTGYASIPTAVEAIKLGAVHYLTKPASADAVEAAFHCDGADEAGPAIGEALSVDRLAWDHIQAILAEHDGNISAAARVLGMHRRTLQRKLGKSAARQ